MADYQQVGGGGYKRCCNAIESCKRVDKKGGPALSNCQLLPWNLSFPRFPAIPAHSRATSSCILPTMFTLKSEPTARCDANEPPRFAQTSKVGGSVEREHTAVAVMPNSSPSLPRVVTMVTPPASLRMPALNFDPDSAPNTKGIVAPSASRIDVVSITSGPHS